MFHLRLLYMTNSNDQTILIVKNRAMGDAVIGLSTIQYFRHLYPNAKIIYLIPNWIAPLFRHGTTEADQIIGFDLKSAKDFFNLWKLVNSIKPTLIFELFQSGRTQKFFKLYSLFCSAKYQFHNHHLLKDQSNIHDQGIYKSNIQRDLDGVWSYHGRNKNLPIPNYLDLAPKFHIESSKNNSILFGVIATRETKLWPIDNFIKLGQLIKSDYPEIQINVPLGPSELDQRLKKNLEKVTNIFNIIEKPLDKLSIEIGESHLYIGNDTGLKHICVAMDIKTYTLFGPEPPEEWHPYNKQEHPYFYKTPLECRTKDKHYCGLNYCDSMVCLNEFTPEYVYSVIKKDLNPYSDALV